MKNIQKRYKSKRILSEKSPRQLKMFISGDGSSLLPESAIPLRALMNTVHANYRETEAGHKQQNRPTSSITTDQSTTGRWFNLAAFPPHILTVENIQADN